MYRIRSASICEREGERAVHHSMHTTGHVSSLLDIVLHTQRRRQRTWNCPRCLAGQSTSEQGWSEIGPETRAQPYRSSKPVISAFLKALLQFLYQKKVILAPPAGQTKARAQTMKLFFAGRLKHCRDTFSFIKARFISTTHSLMRPSSSSGDKKDEAAESV